MRKTAQWVKDPEAKRKDLSLVSGIIQGEKELPQVVCCDLHTHATWLERVCGCKEMAQRPEGHMQSPGMGVR